MGRTRALKMHMIIPRAFAGLPWIASVCLLVASASAQPDLIGSETDPELTDAAGNVQYDQTYLGQKNQNYLDLLAGWWDYENTTDRVALHWKVVDDTALQTPAPENTIKCETRSVVERGPNVAANLTIGWAKERGSREVKPYAEYKRVTSTGGPAQFGQPTPLQVFMGISYSAPGVTVWLVERAALLQIGENLTHLSGQCSETGFPPATTVPTYYNTNQATSKSVYSLTDLRRVVGPDGKPDDLENLSPHLPSANTSAESDPGTRSPSLGPATLPVVVLAVAMVVRRLSSGKMKGGA